MPRVSDEVASAFDEHCNELRGRESPRERRQAPAPIPAQVACVSCVHCMDYGIQVAKSIAYRCTRPVFDLVTGPECLDRACRHERVKPQDEHSYGVDHQHCGTYGTFYKPAPIDK